ncbi:MAG: 16S rRNA (guanine(966)-N(2))-methyltransferase RsmD [Acidobacteriota bacterium]|nr:16S rRNA (guanine(966)-N(2))-methyltransferase RsmD [Acidobacteriota bacterium]
MRVIGGEYRSRRLQSMPGMDVRPTPDKIRQALFNILSQEIEGAVFVDAYAGTGAVGIEALSRGARHTVFIEKDRAAAALIRSNLALLKAGNRARVIHGPAAIYLGGIEADIVFIDPPYPKEKEYQASLDALAGRPPGLAVVQHATRFTLEDAYGPLHRTRVVKYGENALSFYRNPTAEASSPKILQSL